MALSPTPSHYLHLTQMPLWRSQKHSPRWPWKPFLSADAGATSDIPEAKKDCKGASCRDSAADCWVLQLYLLTLSLQLPLPIPHFSWHHQLSQSEKGGCLLHDTVSSALDTFPKTAQESKSRTETLSQGILNHTSSPAEISHNPGLATPGTNQDASNVPVATREETQTRPQS